MQETFLSYLGLELGYSLAYYYNQRRKTRNSKKDRKVDKKESFVQQYLWLEEDVFDRKPQIKKEEAEERGVIVIDMV